MPRLIARSMLSEGIEAALAAALDYLLVGLWVLLLTGVPMLAGVATKCYHNPFYWTKMIALAVAVLFVFTLKQPLLRGDHSTLRPATLKLMALASMSVW